MGPDPIPMAPDLKRWLAGLFRQVFGLQSPELVAEQCQIRAYRGAMVSMSATGMHERFRSNRKGMVT